MGKAEKNFLPIVMWIVSSISSNKGPEKAEGR